MNKIIFESFNYSLFTNYKKRLLDNIGIAYFNDVREFSLAPEDVMALLIVTENDCDKAIMSEEELDLFKLIASNIFFANERGMKEKVSWESICKLISIISEKRVSDKFNGDNCFYLASMFSNTKGFNISVLKKLLMADDNYIDEDLYKEDGGLLKCYYKKLANIYINRESPDKLFDDYMAAREAHINREYKK